MQNMFYVSHNGSEVGPFSLQQMMDQVASGQLAITDYLYDESKNDWVLLLEHQALNELIKGSKPASPPKQPKKEKSATHQAYPEANALTNQKPKNDQQEEWFVLKWDNRYGPFTLVDLVKMLQEKSIFEFDYVWRAGLETWQRVAELPEFKPENVRDLKSNAKTQSSEVFFRRRHVRSRYNGSIIVHDQQSVWKGQSFELSEGGAGIVMHNSMILPGQKLYLHFKPGDGVPPFNAICEVVSKQYVKGVKNKEEPVGYGVKFLEINGDVQKALREYTSKAA